MTMRLSGKPTGLISPPGAIHPWNFLVEAIAGGDTESLAALYSSSRSLVYAIALRHLGDPADAEDVTLDVYLYVWRSAQLFDEKRGSALAWLATITRSRAFDHLRARARRSAREQAMGDEESFQSADDPEGDLQASELEARLRRALGSLPRPQRQALELAYYQELSQTQVALRLGEPLGTIKWRMRSALTKLRSLLTESNAAA